APASEAAADAQSSSPAYPPRPPGYGPRPYPPVYAESRSSARARVAPPRYAPPVRPRPYPAAPPEVEAPAPLAEDQRSALTEARDAFWRQGPEAAATLYQSVAEANPDNPDIQGELANVYFQLGKRAEAAEAYARVVTILHEQGRRAEAARVMRTVAMLDRERAEGLIRELAPPAPDAEGAEKP
ncbi:MAG: tetratricopeptide repeat protein, partial [Chromatiales bacterium]